ncbi:MAG: hypothetical protein CMJ06_02520 [Pelagibacterales bacterium]|nr:hypothetical protein [Pelagibacterales bacterium]OUU62926.1 MAG: hypothetical protein CBC22_02500 [Alphaproteobacteria bacterium TMED62]
MLKLVILATLLIFGACASETAKMAHQIQYNSKNKFNEKNSELCKTMIDKSENEDFIFNSRLIATPIIGIIGLIAAPAILAANASLDLKDRLTASELSKSCGGNGIDPQQIVGDVAVNGSIGFILQGANFSIYPGGNEVPVSTAAEAAAN